MAYAGHGSCHSYLCSRTTTTEPVSRAVPKFTSRFFLRLVTRHLPPSRTADLTRRGRRTPSDHGLERVGQRAQPLVGANLDVSVDHETPQATVGAGRLAHGDPLTDRNVEQVRKIRPILV